MKELIINKKVLLALLVALVIGGTLGWLVKPTVNREETVMSVHDHVNHPDEVWTCSMHPQIRQPEPGQCPICGMDLIPANTRGVSGNTKARSKTYPGLIDKISPDFTDP
ncbi:MAG: heavy metal-binding domain-containing protein, partial [Cyclobacteriaceae bacterium]